MYDPLRFIALDRFRRLPGLLLVLVWFAFDASAQTVLLNFNSPGQYTSNFRPWNDTGGVNGGNYSFEESATNGVGGSGGVAVVQNNDTTATYSSASWDLSTNGATALVSVLLYANGQDSGQVQVGFVNSTANGLNSNAGVAFESFRLSAIGASSWPVSEQHRTGGTTFSTRASGTVEVTTGHWYKFVVGVTNTSGASGNLSAGCALFDYGTDGLTPGANLIAFSTAVSNAVPDLTTGTAVWPALRAFDYGGISAWDNFLVFQSNSPPVFTLSFSNSILATGTTPTFNVLADGPGTITYAWFTNHILASGASSPSFTLPPVEAGYTNVMVVAANGNGSATNSATLDVVVAGPPQIISTPATNIETSSATLGGEVLSTGSVTTTAILYYGTTDGGTNTGAWAQSASLGSQTGAFSQTVALAAGTTYFFTVQASNAFGVVWATPSRSFTTPPITPPQVTNAPATAITANLATLNGQLLSSGGAPTTIMIYYGPADGGTEATAWSNTVSLGLESGSFSQTVGPLSSNTTYYFTAEAMNSAGSTWAVPAENFTTLAQNPSYAVLTYHNDNTRQGVNTNETILTLANVNTNTFGRLFSYSVDGFVYAQPLIMTNVSIPGKGAHNVVYVATEHNSVYAFDADDNSAANAFPLWQTSFLGPGVTTVPSGDVGTSDITPEIGITSTPVIDPANGTIYFEVKTKESSAYVHRLHALDIQTGLERTNFNSPAVITCTNYPGTGTAGYADNDGQNPPHVLWNPLREHSRPALTLLNGAVLMSFAGHGSTQPWHGWLFAYNATNVAQQVGSYNATPNGGKGGFWDGGGGLSVDTQGYLYFQTGDGTFDGGTNITTTNNYAMSLLKFAATNGISVVDYFAPFNAVALSDADQDLGASGPIILPDSAGSAAHPHLLVGGGKTAPIYVVDRDKMGRFNGTSGPNAIVQQFDGGPAGDRDVTPAFFNNTLYIIDSNSRIGAYTIKNASFNTTPVETPDVYDNKGGATPSISASGTTNAILWAIYNGGGESPATPCVLRAYNATNVTHELYSSDQLAPRDSAGDAVKFTVPTIANGKVYVGAQYSLTVYGLAAGFVNPPLISPNGGVFTNLVTVSISDTTPGTVVYYTLDGTTPNSNSISYAGPFLLTNSALVTAVAFRTGWVPSASTASFLNSSAAADGTGLLGQYWANTTSAAFTNTGFNAAPTLTRIDPTINFNWSTTPPATNVGPYVYCVRWTGAVEPQFSETYTFYTTTDDGTRLWVNDKLLVDAWEDQSPTTWSGSITLVAQQRYNIRMDYYQNGGGAQAQLFWSSPAIEPMTIIPQLQLYPVSNPPPVVTLTSPTNGATYTAGANVTVSANAAAQYNEVQEVDFYANNVFIGAVSNAPYTLTTTSLGQGTNSLLAVALDTTGLVGTSAPVSITGLPGFSFTGHPYLSNGVFTAQVSGSVNKTYVLLGSTDFITWVPVSTNVPASSPFTMGDPQAGAYRYRFYRALQMP